MVDRMGGALGNASGLLWLHPIHSQQTDLLLQTRWCAQGAPRARPATSHDPRPRASRASPGLFHSCHRHNGQHPVCKQPDCSGIQIMASRALGFPEFTLLAKVSLEKRTRKMTVGHMGRRPRKFQPSSNPGGSKPGKPQGKWPWVLKIMADAVFETAKGTSDAWKKDRSSPITKEQFRDRMEMLAPGWQTYMQETNGSRKTPWDELLYNRVYKMHYSGTSDRGKNHDPSTRACESGEHWTKRFHMDDPLARLHEAVTRGETRVDWRSFLCSPPQ